MKCQTEYQISLYVMFPTIETGCRSWVEKKKPKTQGKKRSYKPIRFIKSRQDSFEYSATTVSQELLKIYFKHWN